MVIRIREFLIDLSQRFRIWRHYSGEVRVASGVLQGSVLGLRLFLAYVNDVWRNIESKIGILADDCKLCRKIFNISDVEKLQSNVDRLGNWAEGNETKIIPNKSKTLSFTRARVKDPLNYSFGDQKIPKASCCKCLGIIVRSDLSWTFQVSYEVQKAWRALHFVMRIVKKGK